MLQLFPFLPWLATIASAVMLLILWKLGETTPRALLVLLVWFGVAVGCQFGARSFLVAAIGSLLQTALAVYLLIRWRLAA